MINDVEQRSPRTITTPDGASREVEERAALARCGAPSHRSWEEFCATYKPGRWNPAEEIIDDQAAALLYIVNNALRRLDFPRFVEIPTLEETSAGMCYVTTLRISRGAA